MPDFSRNRRRTRRRQAYLVALMLVLMIGAVLLIVPASRQVRSMAGRGRDAFANAEEAAARRIAAMLGEDGSATRVLALAQDRDSSIRELAIRYLAEIGALEALPVLRRIVRDASDRGAIRNAALEAVFIISPEEGRDLARDYARDDVLGATSRTILDGGESLRRRPPRIMQLVDELRERDA
jgi:HEAT repeat protein